MKTVNLTNDINLSIPEEKLGILVSGGADSAILLYFILKYTSKPLHIFSIGNLQKKLTTMKTCIDVIGKCAQLTNNYNFIHHIKYVTEQNKENLYEIPNAFLQNGEISYLYSAVTKNPPDEITSKFKNSNTENDERDPNFTRPLQVGNVFYPWTNIDKKDICNLYKKYDLYENLYPLTRSCEWMFPMGNVPDPGHGHCGECWWCEERLWGFSKL